LAAGEAVGIFTHVPSPPILVVGATGRTGRHLVDELLRAGAPVRALTRRSSESEFPAGVDVATGDLTAPESLDAAFRDIAAVFFVWTEPLATAADVIDRLAAAAPARIVHLSSPHRTPHPFFQQPNALRAVHAEIERLLVGSGIPTTMLRPGMLASNAIYWWAQQIREGGVVRWPYAAAETAPIDERDIAAVAARALLDDRHAGADYVLTGPEALTHEEQVRAIGEAIGRPVRFEELSPDEFRRETSGTWPPPVVEMLLSAWGAALGHPAFVTSTVAEITGEPARTFAGWAADNAAAFSRA
jgi:uncharacterized protein YbjT (DUF2867 family)